MYKHFIKMSQIGENVLFFIGFHFNSNTKDKAIPQELNKAAKKRFDLFEDLESKGER